MFNLAEIWGLRPDGSNPCRHVQKYPERRKERFLSAAEIARLGFVTRARVTQIMNLLHLAPDIQEDLLNLPEGQRFRDQVTERDLRPIAAVVDWRKQRRMWRVLSRETGSNSPE